MSRTYAHSFGVCAALALSAPAAAGGLVPETIFVFNTTDGANPEAPLVADAGGHLYGTASSGGASGGGTAFRPTPPATGKKSWTVSVLHQFAGNEDGYDSLAPLLLHGSAIFGVTFQGGSGKNGCYADGLGCGTIFELAEKKGGGCIYHVLHRFSAAQSADDGNTACAAGQGCGVWFELQQPKSGTVPWTETVLHRFTGKTDGGESTAGLVASKAVIYGDTLVSGAASDGTGDGHGTVFKLVKAK